MPTLTTYCDKDASMDISGGTIFNGTDITFRVGYINAKSEPSGDCYGLMHFSIGTSTLPTGSTVSSATVGWYIDAVTGFTAESYSLVPDGTAFTETDGTTPGVSGIGTASGTLPETVGAQSLSDATVLGWAQGWVGGTLTNGGLIFNSGGGLESDDLITIRSREYTAGAGDGSEPYFTMVYTVPTPTAPGAWTAPTVDKSRMQDGGTETLSFTAGDANGGPAITYAWEYAYKVNIGDAWGAWNAWGAAGTGTSYNWPVGTSGNDGYYKFRARTYNGYNYSAYGPESSYVRLIPNNINLGVTGIPQGDFAGGSQDFSTLGKYVVESGAGAIDIFTDSTAARDVLRVIASAGASIVKIRSMPDANYKFGMPVTPGEFVYFDMNYSRFAGAGTIGVGFRWFDAAGGFLSDSAVSYFSGQANPAYGSTSGSKAAPASAAYVLPFIAMNTAAGGDTFYIKNLSVTRAPSNHTIVRGPVTVSAVGNIASGQAMGSPVLSTLISVSPTGIATAQAFGTAVLTIRFTLSPSSIASGESFGLPAIVPGIVVVSNVGAIASGQALGTPYLAQQQFLLPGSIASAEALGAPSIHTLIAVSPAGIASAEALSAPVLVLGTVTISPSGLASVEAFGIPFVIPPSLNWIERVGFDLDRQSILNHQLVLVHPGRIDLVKNWGQIEVVQYDTPQSLLIIP